MPFIVAWSPKTAWTHIAIQKSHAVISAVQCYASVVQGLDNYFWTGGSKSWVAHFEEAPLNPARGLGEHCKLPQRSLGRSLSRNRIWYILAVKKRTAGSHNFSDFAENQLTCAPENISFQKCGGRVKIPRLTPGKWPPDPPVPAPWCSKSEL